MNIHTHHLATCITAVMLSFAAQHLSGKSLGWHADTLTSELQAVSSLPPAPEGVTDLRFEEFFATPVGPGGLTPTPKLRELTGKRVRVLGFMVHQTRPAPGVALLAPYALSTHEDEYGHCDDLPPATVSVHVPEYSDIAVPHTPGPLLLTGRLELGAKQESDGRISYVRLILDEQRPHAPASAPAEVAHDPLSS